MECVGEQGPTNRTQSNQFENVGSTGVLNVTCLVRCPNNQQQINRKKSMENKKWFSDTLICI